jgi:hypothetical protein
MSASKKEEQSSAVYECDCGQSVTFPERRWPALRYMTRKMGYQNPSEFVQANQSCCDRPLYMEVTGYEPGSADNVEGDR